MGHSLNLRELGETSIIIFTRNCLPPTNVDSHRDDKASAVSKLAESLRYHMPNVYNMYTTDDNKFSRAVVNAYFGDDSGDE